jgi:predicted signal transduction protein with EAL and GGDEF domain
LDLGYRNPSVCLRQPVGRTHAGLQRGEITEHDHFVHQLPQPHKNGGLVWTEVITHYFRDPITNKVMIHGVTRDITERKKLDEKVHYLASHDTLTGILNRSAFFEKGELLFWEAKRNQGSLSFLHFDLNHFKPLNDTYGHHFGDRVLQYFAQKLTESFNANDHTLIARLGGDETDRRGHIQDNHYLIGTAAANATTRLALFRYGQ